MSKVENATGGLSLFNVTHRVVNVFRSSDNSYRSLGPTPYQEDLESCRHIAHDGAYGDSLDFCIPEMWEQLLAEKRLVLVMIEKHRWGRSKKPIVEPVGFRLMLFIKERAYEKLLFDVRNQRIEPSITAHIFKMHGSGKSPILTREEVAHDNAHSGLYMFSPTAHDSKILTTPFGLLSYARQIVSCFVQAAEGYNGQAAVIEGYSSHAKAHSPRSGFDIEESFTFPDYYRKHIVDPELMLFIAHAHQSQANEKAGTHVANASYWNEPVLNLTSLQRDSLDLALEGASDEVLAGHYGTTEEAIRQRFAEIGRRIADEIPKMRRSRANRGDLLHYFKSHREEARPYDPGI